MGRVVRAVAGAGLIVAGALTGNFQLVLAGAALVGGALQKPAGGRVASASQLQLGEQPRQAVLGRMALAGSLVDAFNYGGKYNSDWEVLVIALADHRCDALEGVFVDDTFHAFTGDGNVAGFNNQLQVFWRSGTWDQTVPAILTTNGPGWTANDRGRGVAYVVVAYKSDDEKAKNPVWQGRRPQFKWVVRGQRCYQARKDSTVGGSGAHRRDDPSTWEWTENPIDNRYNWVRGIYAGDRVDQPEMLLIGRGLTDIEAPPQNVFARANLCDETVDGAPRYRIGALVSSTEAFIDVESDFAAAVAGTISQPEGAVEVDPGEAKAPVAHFTDGDLITGSTVKWSDFLGQDDDGWVNTVAASFIDPAQRWTQHSAPVRRDLADIAADGGPREQRPALQMVTNGGQAQRVAEVIRRMGRLWGRGQVKLAPRFAFIEEGDWVTWQSARHFGGATLTFRVDAWGSDQTWHHQLTLRQISASVFSDTAPLDDGSIASNQPPPPVVAAPDEGAWAAAGVLLDSGGVRVPAIRVTGASDDPAAQFVVFEYVQQAGAPDGATVWSFAGSARPDITRIDIPAAAGGTFWIAVSYVVDGIAGARRVLGPVTTTGLTYQSGDLVSPIAPANANRVPFSLMEGNRGWGLLFNPVPLAVATDYGEFQGLRFFRAQTTATAGDQQISIGTGPTAGPAFKVTPGERLSVQARLEFVGDADGTWQLEFWTFESDGVTQSPIVVASGSSPRSIVNDPIKAFADVPAGRVFGRLEFKVTSANAGFIQVAISEPMVTSAALGQTVHPAFTRGPNSDDAADVTATSQRSIVPQFPIIEIRQGEAGNVGNRVVPHAAFRGTAALTGGTWSLPAQSLGAGSASINASTGEVTLSGIAQSGSYTIRYTHADSIATDLAVNVTYVPAAIGAPIGVSLSDTSAISIVAGAAALANYSLQSSGVTNITGKASGFWINPQTGMAGYEARATLRSGTIINGTFGTWLSLGTNRTWGSPRTTVGENVGEMLLEIRLASTGGIVAAAIITIFAQRI
ncbi:MAG: phage tail protein [Erythrobacter sp.]|nr:phage tail protein [Erythrobacter sp.]MDZ4273241.1 phage tail protein [Erythrobacter sp.]MDZ4276293.1 phage tail protein [Erythrobacter sp.]